MVKGESAIDLARHFIEYWNYAKLDKGKDKKAYKRLDYLRPTNQADLLDNEDHRSGNISDEIFSDVDREIK
jgi:phosphatidylserine/phosphatidylglycerophosphate/cardiolipin synthase-like enzyme